VNSTSFEYQYDLKDHLGNVRSTLTSTPGVVSSIADFEGQGYDNTRRVNSILFDHTRKGTTHFAQRLNGSENEKYGLSRSFSVMPGDTVKMEVFVKYVDPNKNNWTTALNAVMSQVASAAASSIVVDGGGYGTANATSFPFAGLNGASNDLEKKPKIYLNWLLFDRNYVFKDGGYVKMQGDPKEDGSNVDHGKLSKELVVDHPGYVYIYYSNEELQPLEVYFDDFAITHIENIVIQQTDYDSFGLTFNEYRREQTVANNFVYNGKELQKDFDLNWYDYGVRQYDAALGRWHVIDPKADKYADWSPYNYVLNNPIKLIDPDGQGPIVYRYGDYVTAEQRETITQGLEIAQTTEIGNEIFETALQNKKVKITILFEEPNKGAFARTGPLRYNDPDSRGKTSELPLKNSKQQLHEYLIAINPNMDVLEIAEAILHQIHAHVNARVQRQSKDLDEETIYENFRYGEFTPGVIVEGTTADYVHQEVFERLWKITERSSATRKQQNSNNYKPDRKDCRNIDDWLFQNDQSIFSKDKLVFK
jgi:RHS repeat-associated protein